MEIKEFLKEKTVLLDGGMGTLLQAKGLKSGELPEEWNITHPDVLTSIHLEYLNAGSDVITANTFGANSLKFNDEKLEEIIRLAIENAKKAIELSKKENKFTALDIGPTGRLLKPFGDLDFEDAVSIFKKTAALGEKYGADLVIIETMNDLYEAKAAVIAVKEATNLPFIVSNAYSENGKLITGASVNEVVTVMESLSADAVGMNCSFGPEKMLEIAKEMVKISKIPVVFMPNAGLPKIENGKTVFDVSPERYEKEVKKALETGVRIVGGCCGTTPEYIARLRALVDENIPCEIKTEEKCAVCSGTKTVIIGNKPVIIGERINPTGKKRFRQALVEHDIAYVLEEGIKQQQKGADILDVNVGIPDIDEKTLVKEVVSELQGVSELPLQIDTSNIEAMENALRIYNGKPLINSVNGKEESMNAIFPLVKKYGGVLVCLTLDENGIPETAEGRFEIAKKIYNRAKEFGISENDLIFDTLCMTLSTNKLSAKITVDALKLIKEKLNARTVLGISNISYGLPDREKVNAEFLSFALNEGLSAAIINPFSEPVYEVINKFNGKREENINITDFAEKVIEASYKTDEADDGSLETYILRGQKIAAARKIKELLATKEALNIINEEIIPALDKVGNLYEEGKIYLPQLLMSAETAKAAFEIIKEKMVKETNAALKKGKFVLATVKGDIHDIGKNIVKLILENYGYDVIDLGKDVSPEIILNKVKEERADFCGLSALMTTTVPAMEQTVLILKKEAPWCKIVVGGAVLNEEYAEKMKADKYCKDALSAVKFADKVLEY